MGEEILNESCSFVCSNAQFPSPFMKAMDPSSMVSDGGKKILTVNAKCYLTSPVPCKMQPIPNTPNFLPCSLASTAPWCSTNQEMTSLSAATLTEKSYCICATFGGKITPQKATLQSTARKNGMSSSLLGSIKGGNTSSSTLLEALSISPVPSLCETNVGGENNLKLARHEEMSTILEEQTVDKSPESDNLEEKYLICDYQSCEKKESCAYYQAEITVQNDSQKLRRNYYNDQEFQEECERYFRKEQSGNEKLAPNLFGNQAHHMISGNQCFMEKNAETSALKFGVLVRLANFFGYDINQSTNCILLPSPVEDTVKDSTALQDSAFDVMLAMGAQWHSGGHAYQLDTISQENIANYYRKHPEKYKNTGNSKIISNYKELVCGELEKLVSRKYSRKQCLLKDSRKKKEVFFKEMNLISAKIKGFLDKFSQSPTDSYPFFVSHYAVSYAYNIPSVTKIIVLYTRDKKTIAQKCHLTRYKKDNQEVVVSLSEEHIVKDFVEFVRFCRNFVFFIVPVDIEIPFVTEVRMLPIYDLFTEKGSLEDKIQKHKKEIMTHTANYGKNSISEATLVSLRQKEVKGGLPE